ncbi:MAG: DUF1592 domain-containing protein [Bryobacterales bacterium]|nr:DUF1592 domain-containing protein [Bryobacterales bacterium]
MTLVAQASRPAASTSGSTFLFLLAALLFLAPAAAQQPDLAVVQQYCVACHQGSAASGGVALDQALAAPIADNAHVWEKVARQLRAGQMPPAGLPRPDAKAYAAVLASLEDSLDQAAAANPNPGRTDTFRRLNRTEYQNAVRDLLAVEIDAASLLPADESSRGFDNITVGDLSPTLLDRYITAAEKISRLAVGSPVSSPGGDTVRLPPDLTQEERVEGLPVGTRGGALIPYTFPLDGEYEISIRLARDRNEEIEGLKEPHQVELLLDNERLDLFTVTPPGKPNHSLVDAHLKVRIPVSAGLHQIGATFIKKPTALIETARQPYEAHFNFYRHPRIQPAVYSVTVIGPYGQATPGDTPSRARIFSCRPSKQIGEEDCAKQILSKLTRLAYRRPVDDADLARPLALYRKTRDSEGFEAGVEMALRAILVSPEFLFRVQPDPEGLQPGQAYELDDLALASRLSFFLWSSIPDDELLTLAEKGQLNEQIEPQVRRMLADPRAQSLIDNFAAQWLYLRNLDSTVPDMRLFPDFDDNLRQALRRETELFFESVVREDRSVMDLISADYTFLNERLAKHYGVPNIYGSRFRRVSLDPSLHRGGLLRQGSILTVTSYATRTSPVIRGKWLLDNILGTPAPPPPPNVPALDDNKVNADLPVRERLMEHRKNPVCASCHQKIDPLGFALESYDAVGRFRATEAGKPVDDSGHFPDGKPIDGVAGLEQALADRPGVFVRALTEKLMTYALGRGVEYYDAPAVRRIVREAEDDDYRFSAIVSGIAQSVPFQMRTSQ